MVVATKVELYGHKELGGIRRFLCASGTKISKGTVLKLTSPRTASASSSAGDLFAGIAAADKSATDYSTSVSAWEDGVFELYSSGTVTAGDKVVTGNTAGYLRTAAVGEYTSDSNKIVGYALKSGTEGTKIQVRVNN